MRLLSTPEIWTLKGWDEVPDNAHGQDSNTWSPIPCWDQEVNGTGGVTVQTQLDLTEINFVKAANNGVPIFWQWADKPDGTIYWGKDWRTDIQVWWPHCLQASSVRQSYFNRVIVDARADNSGRVRARAIPHSIDYSPYLHDLNFMQRIFTQDGYNACHGEATFMAIFSGGFKVKNGFDALWFDPIWLREKVGQISEPIPPSVGDVRISYRGTDFLGRVKNLNVRPEPTMFNTEVGYLYPNAITPLQGIIENTEGVWGMINPRLYIALYLSSNKTYYTSWRP